jgi:hypothetical protein
MNIVYYMPVFLKKHALATEDEDLLRWCEIFNLINSNSCFLDRTGTIVPPFSTQVLYPLPELTTPKSFEEVCLDRAAELLRKGKQIVLLYSGGLDSTTILVALDACVKAGIGSSQQVVVAATPESVAENRQAWFDLVLPNYEVVHTSKTMRVLPDTLYVQGENSDQLFGPVQQTSLDTATIQFDSSQLDAFLQPISEKHRPFYHEAFTQLAKAAPIGLPTMKHFLWWMNFTCKWQAVALRTLTITDLLKSNSCISKDQALMFDTFFNTEDFQQLALAGLLSDHSEVVTQYTIKKPERDFILKYQPTWGDYTSSKVKMPSLHNVFKLTSGNPVRAIEVDTDFNFRASPFLDKV